MDTTAPVGLKPLQSKGPKNGTSHFSPLSQYRSSQKESFSADFSMAHFRSRVELRFRIFRSLDCHVARAVPRSLCCSTGQGVCATGAKTGEEPTSIEMVQFDYIKGHSQIQYKCGCVVAFPFSCTSLDRLKKSKP